MKGTSNGWHRWSSGRIRRCHRRGPCSIHGRCSFFFVFFHPSFLTFCNDWNNNKSSVWLDQMFIFLFSEYLIVWFSLNWVLWGRWLGSADIYLLGNISTFGMASVQLGEIIVFSSFCYYSFHFFKISFHIIRFNVSSFHSPFFIQYKNEPPSLNASHLTDTRTVNPLFHHLLFFPFLFRILHLLIKLSMINWGYAQSSH